MSVRGSGALGHASVNLTGATGATTWRVGVYALSTLAAVTWTLLCGKDLNQDALTYHYYAGLSALHNRFDLDFLASGLQSYFNPYAHIPFYLMVSAGMPSIAIAAVLATFHSTLLWLTYEFALELGSGLPSERRQGIALFSVILAALNPIFLQQVGSTFSDVTTGVLSLAGWLGLARAFRVPGFRPVVVAGALGGAAAALKLSNAIFSVAGIAAFAVLAGGWRWRFRSTAAYTVACAIAFGVVGGPWAWRLWQEFGNPFFPFFNEIFKSPEFIVEPIRHLRFVPETFAQGLWRPVAIALPDHLVHSELRAPDVRYAALLAALAATACVLLTRRIPLDEPGRELSGGSPSWRALTGLTASFALAWAMWLRMSGNSRYFVPMACVAGVLLVLWLARLLRRADWLVLVLGLLVLLQATEVSFGSRLRWSPMEWEGPWFRADIPDRLQREPYLYLTMATTSGSFLLPNFAPGSGMMSVSGAYTLAPDGPGGARATELIERFGTRLRSLDQVTVVSRDGTPTALPLEVVNARFRRFGLQVDPTDCEWIPYADSPGPLPDKDFAFDRRGQRRTNYYHTCALVRAEVDLPGYLEERRAVDVVFDRVEDACPNLFQPARMMTEKNGLNWRRVYMNTDLELWINDGWIKYFNGVRGGVPLIVGRASDWSAAPRKLDCSQPFALAGKVLLDSR